MTERSELANEVTARGARSEPFHRWLNYVQGYSPGLVRRFLAEAGVSSPYPVLDPFSGSGTTVIECARLGQRAVGVESVLPLAFLTRARGFPRALAPTLPTGDGDYPALMAGATTPRDRAAVLFAAARTVDGEGQKRALTARPAEVVAQRMQWMDEDTCKPLVVMPEVVCGDARQLPFSNGVFGGVLTSPPYLSRYDYARINAPLLELHGGRSRNASRRSQVRAARVHGRRNATVDLPPAAEEAAIALEMQGDGELAATVRNYFSDLDRVIAEMARVLRPHSPAWVIVGGADMKRAYIPSDLILADMALAHGFQVESIFVARRLRPSGRRLGDLIDLSPRESVVCLRAC